MSEILGILTLLVETLMVFQCIQIVFGKTIKIDKYVVGIILTDIVVYMLINLKMISVLFAIILYLLFFVLCYFKFKLGIIKTVIRLIISFSLVGCLEGLASFLTNFFRNEDNSMIILLLSVVIAWFLAWSVRQIVPVFHRMVEKGKVWKIAIVIFYGILLVGLFVDYHFNHNPINIYVVFALVFLMFVFFYLYRLENAQNEIVNKNYELELQRIYGKTYEDLLIEVRRRQHDYKNQLGAMYGMHLTAKSLDELISMQKNYGIQLQADSKFDSILTCCNNSVLAGFIYYKCVSCEKIGVLVECNIHIEQAECCFALYEIIEILGILIDNACENVKAESSLEQRMILELQESTDKIIFSVSNPAKYVSFEDIDKMFIRGYSTKGENRGIGLERVLELINKYDAEIKVHNSVPCDKENWIHFIIEIHK